MKLKRDNGVTRYFSGVCVEGGWTQTYEKLHGYQLVLRPWFWLLTQASDNRIFQNRSVLSIIKRVFKKAGFADYEIKTTESYKPIEYCVQYGESHFDFVSRLMETFGIYYFFRHTEGKHVMVLADGRSSHVPIPELPTMRYVPYAERSRDTAERLNIWRPSRKFRTGKVTLRGFDFDKPHAKVTGERSSPGGYAHGDLEQYDYPGLFKSGEQDSLAQTFIRATLHSHQAQDRRRHAEGDLPNVSPGGLTTLVEHPIGSENQQYLVVSARHSFVEASYASSHGGSGETLYEGAHEFQPADRPFKAPQTTPKPTINGPQTATVVGPSGEEIYTDKHGRIKVQFHWDRLGQRNEKSSRWMRVAQVWSGSTWGGMVIPRIGQEVVVEFIEGDPDRPLVTGTVFNGEKMTAYDLPANKTRMVLRSNTHKGVGFNEVSFEDENSKQKVLMHAQKDMTHKVLNNQTARVDNSMATSVGAHQAVAVGGNSNNEVGGSQTNVVGGTGPGVAEALAPLIGLMGQSAGLLGQAAGLAGGLGPVEGLVTGVVGQAAQALLGVGAAQGLAGVISHGTKGDMGGALAGAGAQLLQGVGQMFGQSGVQKNIIGQAQVTAVGQAASETVGKTKVINVGATFFTQVGKKYKIEVGEELEIVVGKSHLVMKKDGSVTLQGVRFTFAASGSVQINGEVIDLN